jgi:cellulose biosynthesis protein BcsQ
VPTIVFHNHKGGVGKTMLAAHCVWLAMERGKRVLALDVDAQGNLIQMLAGSTASSNVTLPGGSRVDWRPGGPHSPAGTWDLVVVDCPPAHDAPDSIVGDLWVVPVDGRQAAEGAATVISRVRERYSAGEAGSGAAILVVFNGVGGGKRALEAVRQASRGLAPGDKRAGVALTEIPYTPAIRRSAENLRPAWFTASDARVAGVRKMRAFLDAVLNRVLA